MTIKNRILDVFFLPANRSVLELALAFAAFQCACALWAILWQADVIAYQRELINDLWLALQAR